MDVTFVMLPCTIDHNRINMTLSQDAQQWLVESPVHKTDLKAPPYREMHHGKF